MSVSTSGARRDCKFVSEDREKLILATACLGRG
jgi:hypothetical protein